MPFPFNILVIIFLGIIIVAIARAFSPSQKQITVEPVDDLLLRLDGMPISDFVDLMVSLFSKMGLRVDNVEPLDKDLNGVAILGFHPRELIGGSYAIYCVRQLDREVGIGVVHRLRSFAKTEGAMKAILITTGFFSHDAENVISALPGVPIELVDGEKLRDWLYEHLPQEISELPPAVPSEDDVHLFPN